MLGADTELDRQVLELIKDPLTHMVRNSGDHGLESPAERRAAGKPETGHITLNAYHEGGHIIIEIADDGRGLPLDRIRAKVLANGLATEAELAGMSEAQIAALHLPRRLLHRRRGHRRVRPRRRHGRGEDQHREDRRHHRPEERARRSGTTFTIKIPLTLAIVSALIVEAGGERFAIPQISVVELVRAQKEAGRGHNEAGSESVIERINDTPVLRLRDRLLPLVNLNDLLALGESQNDDSGAYIVVAQVGASSLGIIVDRVFDTEEIVVKPVAPILRHVTMFSGNTILGDGSVIMILDPNGIARAHRHRRRRRQPRRCRRAPTDSAALQPTARRCCCSVPAASRSWRCRSAWSRGWRTSRATRSRSSCGAPVTQYRGKLMPLVALAGNLDAEKPRQSVLVFNDGDRTMGLMVDEIVDVVEDRLDIELSGARPGLLGSAVIGGQATDVIDTGYWLTQAWQDWFHGAAQSADNAKSRRVLVVEDSDFFRQLVTPILGAAGYRVTAAPSAAEALRLREAGAMFDAIVSDIEMPDMDGLDFARAVRAGGPWARLPMIALSARAEPADIEAGRDAGFTDYVAKFQREALIASLRQCLAEPIAA